jgi:hypothetical protein
MGLNKVTVELSDNEIAILEQLAKKDGGSPNDALRKAIAQAGYLLEQTNFGRNVYVGNVHGDRIQGNQISIGDAKISRD